MMNLIGIFFFFFFLLHYSTAQTKRELDSLLIISETEKDERMLPQIYSDLCWQYRNISPENSILYAEKGIELAQKYHNLSIKSQIYNRLGVTYKGLFDYVQALKYYETALAIASEANDIAEKGYAYNNIANGYLYQLNYALAINWANKAMACFEQVKDLRGQSFVHVTLAGIYKGLKNREEQKKHINLSYNIRESQNAYPEMMISLRMNGQYYEDNNDLEEAKKYYLKALKLFEDKHLQTGHYTYYFISKIYLQQKKLDSALLFINKGIQVGKIYYVPGDFEVAFNLLADIYNAKGAYADAYKYAKLASLSKDTISKINNTKALATHAFQQKNKELLFAEMENKIHKEKLMKKESEFRLIIIFSLLIVGSAAFYTYFILRSNQRKRKAYHKLSLANQEIIQQKEELQEQSKILAGINETKNKLFSIVSHDLRSPINTLKAFLDLMKNNHISNEEFFELLPNFSQNVNEISSTLENILLWANSQMSGIAVIPTNFDIMNVINENVLLFKETATNKKIKLLANESSSAEVFADINHIRLTLRNLINNAIKFTPENGQIVIKTMLIDDMLQVAITDSGVGVSDEKMKFLFDEKTHFTTYGTGGEKGTGIGLLLCKEMIEKNGGTIAVKSTLGEGSTFSFTIPLFI